MQSLQKSTWKKSKKLKTQKRKENNHHCSRHNMKQQIEALWKLGD